MPGARPLLGALLLAALLAAPAAADESLDDLLGGFDDDPPAGNDSAHGGFDDDELGGFGDDDLGGFDDVEFEPIDDTRSPLRGESYTVTGSLSLGSSINFIPHHSSTGTNYTGVQRLRTRLNLEADVDLPWDWEFRGEGFAYYDWAYLANGRSSYTDAVLEKYEYDVDTQDFWIRGTPLPGLDVKIGRQVVNWGRSETLRVLDVLNPLDNREPGIADIEDLRRAVTMGRFDYYLGDWNLTLVAIPEMRRPLNPVPGSDFFPALPQPPPGFPPSLIVRDDPASLENWEAAAALTGIFEGWDVSFHGAWYFDDFGVLRSATPVITPQNTIFFLDYKRLWLAGGGGQYTFGSWLVKAEAAYVDGIGFTDAPDGSRLDAMLGVEYYGLTNTTITLELAHSQIFDFPSGGSVSSVGGVAQEESSQLALRVTRTFLRERLESTLLALLLSGDGDTGDLFTADSEIGAVIRLDASYDLRDALVLTGGVLIYVENDIPPLATWGDNDRLFLELKWSF